MAATISNSPNSGMYKLQPYYKTSQHIDPPTCMYRLNKVYSDTTDMTGMDEKLSPELKQLEQRQESILQRLGVLSAEVEKMSQNQPKPLSRPVASQSKTAQLKEAINGNILDLVVSCSVSHPPLSLLVLANQLSEQYRILTTGHIHSSAQGMAADLMTAFCGSQTIPCRGNYQLILTIIWKDDKRGTSLMVSPNLQTQIYGEANVARYLSRLLSPAYDSFDIISATEVDGWLDLSAQLLNGNNKERAAVLRTLNASLGKNSWVAGSQPTLADVVVWSALQQNRMTQAVPSNVKKWLESCSGLPGFQRALRVVSLLSAET